MFTTITAKPHAKWAQELPMLAGGSFTTTFGPGLNVLVGPNGSGKSVLLRALEAYAMFERRFFRPPRGRIDKECVPGWVDQQRSTSTGIELEGGWTGTTTWRIEPHTIHQIHDMDELFNQTELDEQVFRLRLGGQHLSNGEKTWTGLEQAVNAFKRSPLYPSPVDVTAGASSRKVNAEEVNRILADAKAGASASDQRTLLIDEPEQSFDFSRRIELAEMLDDHANTKPLKHQMIITTHCPALMAAARRVIEVVPGTIAAADKYIKWVATKRATYTG